MRNFKMLELNKIYNMDCLDGLKQLEDKSIDTIWTDPPFNINYDYDEYKDNMNEEDYFKWCNEWIEESFRVLKDNGSIFIKIWSFKSYEMQTLLRNNGFVFQNQIVWKRKSQAGYLHKFLGGYEVILFFTKTNNNKFNAEAVLRETEFLTRWDNSKTYKGRYNDLWDDVRPVLAGNLKHEEAMYKKGTGEKEHPAQHPEELVRRCILCSTNENDIVLDLFNGSATTSIVCIKNKRNYIGFELSENYCKLCEKRIRVYNSQKKLDSWF